MLRALVKPFQLLGRGLHTSVSLNAKANDSGLPVLERWTEKNEKVHPPEAPVTPYVYHGRTQIHCGRKKLLPLIWKIRGLSIDDAIAQMEFDTRKAAKEVKAALEDARKEALTGHNVEFASNLWVAESRVMKGVDIKGIRRHARGRMGEIEYRHSHIAICLHEGKPPKHYYVPELTPELKLEQFKRELDSRYVQYSI